MEADTVGSFDGYPVGCPLEGAVSCVDIEVFLLCEEVTDGDHGFRSLNERGGLRRPGNSSLVCKSMGLSVFGTLEECINHGEMNPRLGGKVASARLKITSGKIMKTPTRSPGHHTWWPYSNISRSSGFQVVHHVANKA